MLSLTDIREAHEILREREKVMSRIGTQAVSEALERFSIVIDGESFEIADALGDTIAPADLTSSQSEAWSRQARAQIGGHTYEFEVKVHKID